MKLCPLIFQPIFKPKIWGGRNLATLLDKTLPEGVSIGESWECADLESAQSVVARGPARGRTLHELVTEWGSRLLGRARPVHGRFPLLIKFLDATEPLSIQVHPDSNVEGAGIASKDEAWFILQAEPAAIIYRGLRKGVTMAALEQALRERPASIVDLLEVIRVRAGDAFYLPAGTIHALGGGIAVAEVQMPSDTTYRLYDWDRQRPDDDAGLHIAPALAAIRTHIDSAAHEKRSHVTSVFTTVTRLITCPSFVVEKVRFVEGIEQDIPYAELVCWIVLEGRGEIHYGAGEKETFARGEVVVLPAELDRARLKTLTPCSWLEVTIPVASDLSGIPRPPPDTIRDQRGGGFVQMSIKPNR